MDLVFTLAALPLWIAPALLLLGALVVPLAPKVSSKIALGALAAAAITIAPSAAAALSGQTVLSLVGRVLRIGSLDITLVLALDRVSLIAAVGVLAAAALGVARHHLADTTEIVLWLVSAAAALFGVLSDGLPFLLLGFSVALFTAIWLRSDGATPSLSTKHASLLAAGGTLTVVSAVAILFWSLGGAWLDNQQYFSDYKPRFSAVGTAAEVSPTSVRDPGAKGSLTVVSHPGARVYLGVADESQLRRGAPLGTTPLVRVEVPAGLHKIAIMPEPGATVAGDGFEVAAIDVVQVAKGGEARIALWGPSLTFHEIGPQLQSFGVILQRRLGPTTSGSAIAFLLLLGAGLIAASLGAVRGPRQLFAGFAALLALSTLFARLPWLSPLGLAAVPPVLLACALLAGAFVASRRPRAVAPELVKWLVFALFAVLAAKASMLLAALVPLVVVFLETRASAARIVVVEKVPAKAKTSKTKSKSRKSAKPANKGDAEDTDEASEAPDEPKQAAAADDEPTTSPRPDWTEQLGLVSKLLEGPFALVAPAKKPSSEDLS